MLISMRCTRWIAFSLVLAWPLAAAASRFIDVPDDHRYLPAIEHAWQAGVAAGYPDGSFRPGNLVNRAEFVKFVTLYLYGAGSPELTDCSAPWPYTDVSAEAWYVRYLCRATADGMVQGYADGTFRGDHPITMAEAAKIIAIVDVASGKGAELPAQDGVGPWYKRYFDHLAIRRAIPLEVRSVDEYVTRGQVVEMFYRLDTTPDGVTSRTFDQLGQVSWREVVDECTQEPVDAPGGTKQYPIRSPFEQLGYLGEILTAEECTATRLREVAGTDRKGRSQQYPSLVLSKLPSPDLRRYLEQAGFQCQSHTDPNMCRHWGSPSDVSMASLLGLRQYAGAIASFSCPTCARKR